MLEGAIADIIYSHMSLTPMQFVSRPKPETDESDPQAGLMNMMKKMYDDGDDDMKRTIAKAWTESQDKKTKVDM